METIIERIYKIADYKGDTIYKLSKDIGVSNGYFSKQKLSKGSVSSNIIEKIVSHYDDLNPKWLITGKGSMLLEEVEIPSKALSLNQSETEYKGRKAVFEEVLDELSIDEIITYIHKHEEVRGFYKNETYRMFLEIRMQRELLKKYGEEDNNKDE